MDDVPSTPSDPADGVGRRWFVIGGAVLVVAGAGAGTAARLTRDDEGSATPAPAGPPAQLVAAVARERGLIADLDATTGGAPAVRRLLVRARADHAAHLQALQALLAGYAIPSSSPSSSPSSTTRASEPPAGTARTRAQLRAAETRAAAAAASAAAELDGRTAALLASISACEATHAAVLA